METAVVIIFSYICGSIPFGLIITKIFTDQDIRKIGSGNIGATNVLRTGKKYLAITTLLLDVIKGYIPVLITVQFFPQLIQLSALIVFLGHIFPIWLKFRGGKGVATYLGVLFALSFSLSLLFIFTWVVVSLIFKYSSISSIFSSLTVAVVSVLKDSIVGSINPNLLSGHDIKIILFIFFILIVFTHRKNILNLKNKTETKIKI